MTLRRGASAIEFAFVLPILVIVLFGLLDWGWYMYTWMNVELAANRGARIAAGLAEDPGPRAIEAACETLDGYAMPCDPSTVEYTSDGAAGQVTVDLPYTPLIGLVPTPTRVWARATTDWYGDVYEAPG